MWVDKREFLPQPANRYYQVIYRISDLTLRTVLAETVDDTPRTLNCGSLKILILIEYPYQLVVTLPHSFMTTVF